MEEGGSENEKRECREEKEFQEEVADGDVKKRKKSILSRKNCASRTENRTIVRFCLRLPFLEEGTIAPGKAMTTTLKLKRNGRKERDSLYVIRHTISSSAPFCISTFRNRKSSSTHLGLLA